MSRRRQFTDAPKRWLLAAGHYHRALRRVRFPGVCVLAYHAVRRSADDAMPFANLHVTMDELEAHCRLIRETCHPIGLSDWPAGQRPSVDRPVLVTFDDGYASVLELAAPILQRWEIPAVVFVATDAIATQRRFWFDAVALADGEAATQTLARAPSPTWRARAAAVASAPREHDPTAPMTPAGVRALHALGVEIGAHTVSHAVLSGCDPDEAAAEVTESCRTIASWTGQPARAFAYPVGDAQSLGPPTVATALAAAGVTSAFTTREAFAIGGAAQLTLPRFVMLHTYGASELAHRMVYAWPR